MNAFMRNTSTSLRAGPGVAGRLNRPPMDTRRRARLLGLPALAAFVACVVGGAVGGLIAFAGTAGSTESGGWDEAIWALTGLMVGSFVGVVLWVVGLVLVARRLFPRGHRTGAVWLAVGLGVAAVAASSAVFAVATGLGATGATVFAAGSMTSVLALMASGSVALWLWGRRVGDPMLGQVPPGAPGAVALGPVSWTPETGPQGPGV